ncbi:hypothetical protein SAMN04487911_10162 [Arenibacter nanhaiticus]|uniref:Uncharacterized protein n=1 Tax=Arenibacter nanhaiticus TaxID=558155 RepID=A0A1M6A3I9_9FLAO|nr:hypothetical protein [Arenibacter nanhaiticus]SHI31010.1 hypothetical protein SAMN04487911_10162 [Arenibacter nanhaiticus]
MDLHINWVNDTISIQHEFVFSSQGAAKIIYDGKTINLNYHNIPILALYKLFFLKRRAFKTGPRFDILLSDKNGDTDFIDLNNLNK